MVEISAEKTEKTLEQAVNYLLKLILPLRDNKSVKHSDTFINSVCEFIDNYYHERQPPNFKD